jgi:adenylylsulfate kinase
MTSSGRVVWVTGLPSSGKSTLAQRLAELLREHSVSVAVLDGDAVRASLVPEVGYSDLERANFYETLARLAALLADQALVVIVPATAQRQAFRERARSLAPAFLEVFVDTPLEECERRDAKKLYAASRSGTAANVPGADAAYEPPTHPDVVAQGGSDSNALRQLLSLVLQPAQPKPILVTPGLTEE